MLCSLSFLREFAEGLAKGLREKGVNLDMKNVVISSMLSEDIDKMERFMNKFVYFFSLVIYINLIVQM